MWSPHYYALFRLFEHHHHPCPRSPVLPELVRIINNPELDHPIRGDLAEQYKTDRAAFNKAALEHIKKNAS